ncbi:MAG: RNA 2',3'-cyclic phosphodiesterase [Kiritimatiellae bacterium]|nr:RNA 2',3'-cyclic phosphodiesterase [Kiritimatiellia bacterium]
MRLFIAIDLPDAVKTALERVQRKLRAETRAVRWAPPGQMHLTLLFLGETETELASAIGAEMSAAAAAANAFTIAVRGIGGFRRGRGVGVVWAGIAESQALHALQADLTARIGEQGGDARRKAFAPHITLGRVRVPQPDPPLDAAIARFADYDGGQIAADAIQLYRSEITPTGAVHTRLLTARLAIC